MLKEKDKVIQGAMISLDAAIVSFIFIIACALRPFYYAFYKLDLIPYTQIIAETRPVSTSDYIVVMFFAVPLWSIMLSLNGMYRSMRTRTIFEVLWIVIKTAFFTTLAFGAFVFLFKLKFVSRLFFMIFILGSLISIGLEKAIIFSIMHYVRKQGYNCKRMLIVGTGTRAAKFMDKIKAHPEWGFKIVGVIDDEGSHTDRRVSNIDIIGTLANLQDIIDNNPLDEVVFIIPRSRLSNIENSLYICETAGIRATIAVDLFELKIAKARQTELEDIPLITFETTPAKEWELFLKRVTDIIFSGVGIIILSPLFLLIAILIKTTSPGPVMFLQKRVGLNGRKFILYKFRTMYKGAHEQLSQIKDLNIMKGPVFKTKNDPRVTPIGRFLRRFSIDELPQLFNVFKGHMSLVGPRPPLPQEVAHYELWQRRRLSMRPGITCLWQISGRNKIDFDEWMQLDLQYIDNWSLWLDFKILLKTIPAVFFGVGAY
ncbi:MAG: sugar transferase [Candidatus Omnitrophica bacterium]|nr:sugar transferase [Candidatus Omnitrophota bacterium]